MLSALRHRLGLMKYRIAAMTLGRLLAARAEPHRTKLGQLIQRLHPLANENRSDIEVHMLCGYRDIDMAVVASWSFLRFFPGARLFLHEDGTIKENDIALWRRVVPTIEFISSATGNELAAKALHGLPSLRLIHAAHHLARKLVDVHLVGRSHKLILLDSDVLCFNYPVQVYQCLGSIDFSYAWNQDIRNCYVTSPGRLRVIAGHPVANRVNTGFAVIPRLGAADFRFLETIANAISNLGHRHHWLEQTLYAFLASRNPESGPLGREYNVTAGRSDEAQIVRHYVGSATIRPLFFLEGVARLERQVQVGCVE
jgi:hypothetical protein